jgi:hypothetical protein
MPEQKAPRSALPKPRTSANPTRKSEAHSANPIALERRKLRVKVVNPKPHRQRRIPSVEVRRAEHGHVSERIAFLSQDTHQV